MPKFSVPGVDVNIGDSVVSVSTAVGSVTCHADGVSIASVDGQVSVAVGKEGAQITTPGGSLRAGPAGVSFDSFIPTIPASLDLRVSEVAEAPIRLMGSAGQPVAATLAAQVRGDRQAPVAAEVTGNVTAALGGSGTPLQVDPLQVRADLGMEQLPKGRFLLTMPRFRVGLTIFGFRLFGVEASVDGDIVIESQ